MDKERLLQEYDSVPQEEGSTSAAQRRITSRQILSTWKARVILSVLILSVIANVLLVISLLRSWQLPKAPFRSHNMGLEYSHEELLPTDTEFSTTTNETRSDELWDSLIQIPGAVALDKDFAKEKGLPEAYTFPWDENKGVYVVAAYHFLHCQRAMYISVTEAFRGRPQSMQYDHLLHCLDWWRQNTLCHADDTLLHVVHQDGTITLKDYNVQTHTCRDWSKLQDFTLSHSACYTNHHFADGGHKYENYQNCPKGSPYLEKVREYFHLPESWEPDFEDSPDRFL